jgi:hypothetical protein
MDGVLLKVQNWKEEYCAQSLVATTSLLLLLDLMNIGLSLLLQIPALLS